MEDDVLMELERTVTATLLIVGWISEEPATFIGVAERKLSARADLLNRILNDVNTDFDHHLECFVDTEPVGIHATVLLDDALREIKVRRAHHGKVLSVLNRCIMYRRLDPGEMRRTWAGHHLSADKCAEKALMYLRLSVSSSRVAQDAFDIARTFEERTSPWVYWMRRAEKLEDYACEKVVDAWGEVVNMRRYARMEFYDAWIILYA